MKNLTGDNYRVVLPTLAKTARELAKLHLNHERRRERMEILSRMVESQTQAAAPEYLEWLYVLHFILYVTVYEDLMHPQVKGVLYYFAEMADAAYAELTAPKESG